MKAVVFWLVYELLTLFNTIYASAHTVFETSSRHPVFCAAQTQIVHASTGCQFIVREFSMLFEFKGSYHV